MKLKREITNNNKYMKKKYDAVATIGKFKDREGNEKKRYLNVGIVFEGDDGRLSMKLDALPTTPEWSGWISFYEPKENGQRPAQDSHNAAKSNGYAPQDDNDDQIPF